MVDELTGSLFIHGGVSVARDWTGARHADADLLSDLWELIDINPP